MITKEQALAALEDMDDFARMADIEPIGAYNTLKQYVEQMEASAVTLSNGYTLGTALTGEDNIIKLIYSDDKTVEEAFDCITLLIDRGIGNEM